MDFRLSHVTATSLKKGRSIYFTIYCDSLKYYSYILLPSRLYAFFCEQESTTEATLLAWIDPLPIRRSLATGMGKSVALSHKTGICRAETVTPVRIRLALTKR